MGIRRVMERKYMRLSILKIFIILFFFINICGCVQNKAENCSTDIKENLLDNIQDSSDSQEEVNIQNIGEILVFGIENKLLKDFAVPDGKETLCIYEGIKESPDKRVERYYAFCIYKEMDKKGIFFQNTLLVSCKKGEIFTWIMNDTLSELKSIGFLKDISSHLKDEGLTNGREDKEHREGNISQEEALDGTYEIMVKENGINNIELMLEPEQEFLGRTYYCVTIVDISDWKVTRGKRIFVDKRTGEVYWLLEEEETLRGELWYLGRI